ncbi:MAG: TIGR02452 family protein [Lachnospiraceae bacterium]|nr:TIGR02452 family protein [Lachnospiraceae bacterium]
MNMKQKAQEWVGETRERCAEEIKTSIDRTFMYEDDMLDFDLEALKRYNKSPSVLVDKDTVSCLFDCEMEGRVCVLNFASFKNPGGGFLTGSTTQEEALCHESTLYPVLHKFFPTYYMENRRRRNRALYENRALYSQDILFLRDGRKKVADVLTCAAPNYREASRLHGVTEDENYKVLRSRIEFMSGVMQVQKADTLILGAWGCGVFGNSPAIVCELFDKYMRGFKKIYYAIPDSESQNYESFEDALRPQP